MSSSRPIPGTYTQCTSGGSEGHVAVQSWRSMPSSRHPFDLERSGLFEDDSDPRTLDLEVEGTLVLSVTIVWGGDVLYATHLQRGGEFTLGEGDGRHGGSSFFLPKEVIGVGRLTLLQMQESSTTLNYPDHAEGYVQTKHGAKVALRELSESGAHNAGVAHRLQVPLAAGSRGCVRLGAFAIYFAAVPAPKPITTAHLAFTDREAVGFFGVSLGAIAGFMLSMAYFVPAQNDLIDTSFDEDQIYAMTHFLRASAEREREARESSPTASDPVRDSEGGTGTRAKHEEGSTGNPTSRASNHRWAVQGPKDNPDPHIARARLLWEAQNTGIIGLLNAGMAGDPRSPTAPWGRDDALGRDALSANGNMWGDELGESFGQNGLGLSGIGEGGGGRGEGIGLGEFEFGHGRGKGLGQGFGLGSGSLGSGTHHARSPRMRPGVTAVSGRLPPEVIQRIVRQNYGRFRSCYELGLSRNPNLEGRVQVRFVISRDGSVSNVQNGGSDLPDAGVVGCVIGAYYGLNFPQPEGGIVTVVYPIMFQPG